MQMDSSLLGLCYSYASILRNIKVAITIIVPQSNLVWICHVEMKWNEIIYSRSIHTHGNIVILYHLIIVFLFQKTVW